MQNDSASKGSIQKQLLFYSTAASLGAFAMGQEAAAAIIYTDVTDVTIGQGPTAIYINLDGAGDPEFAIAAHSQSVRVNPYPLGGTNRALTSAAYYVNSFAAGSTIGPGTPAAGGAFFAAGGAYGVNFVGTDKFVGLKWDIGNEQFRYGWAAVDVTGSGSTLQATLKSFAYESEANTAIVAGEVPEPTTIGLLAAGAGALAFRRRREAA